MTEERLQLLSNMASVPIHIKDWERRYVFANRMAHELAGVEPGGLIGHTDAELLSAEAERIAAESDREVLGGATFENVETIVVAGQERTVLKVKFPFLDESGETSGIVGISTDVTSKRLVESLRQELMKAQYEAFHDLRDSRQETVERLALAIEAHDEDTGLHLDRMAATAALLGAKLGFDEERVLLLRAVPGRAPALPAGRADRRLPPRNRRDPDRPRDRACAANGERPATCLHRRRRAEADQRQSRSRGWRQRAATGLRGLPGAAATLRPDHPLGRGRVHLRDTRDDRGGRGQPGGGRALGSGRSRSSRLRQHRAVHPRGRGHADDPGGAGRCRHDRGEAAAARGRTGIARPRRGPVG